MLGVKAVVGAGWAVDQEELCPQLVVACMGATRTAQEGG